MAFVGDVDKDGVSDYALGSPYASNAKGARTGSVQIMSGKTGRLIREVFGDVQGDFFGTSVSAAGDTDRDGYPDVVVGAFGSWELNQTGYARVISGRDGKTLFTFSGTVAKQGVGWSTAGAGDIDKDGHDDIVVGSSGAFVQSRVWLVSGKDGSVIRWWQGPWAMDWFGWTVDAGVDLNSDGYGEILVTAPHFIWPGGASRIYVLDGRYGTTLFTFKQPPTSFSPLGAGGAAFAGDVDRDGVEDLILSWPEQGLGAVRVYSGKLSSGAPLFRWVGQPNEHLGGFLGSGGGRPGSVRAAGDVDRDGFPDLLVAMATTGIARLYSGKDGRPLYTFFANRAVPDRVTSIAAGHDVDKDGYSDILVGDDSVCFCPPYRGHVWLFSGLNSLRANQPTLSITRGGAQFLSLDASPVYGGKPYLVLGSASGTYPGIRLGSVILPLRLDDYTLLTLSVPNLPPFISTASWLDANGKARATFVMPSGLLPASLIGLELNHAFVVFGPSGFEFASNAAPLEFVK